MNNEDDEVVVQHLRSAPNTSNEQNKEKLKTKYNSTNDKGFYDTCKFYLELSLPEYAYSMKAVDQRKCIRVGNVRKDVREIAEFYFDLDSFLKC